MEKNYQEHTFNVSNLSDAIYMDRVTLYRKTLKYFDKTPHQILEDYRLEKASDLLSKDDVRVKEVAFSIGYSNPQYFSMKFKKRFGVSPREFKTSKIAECIPCA